MAAATMGMLARLVLPHPKPGDQTPGNDGKARRAAGGDAGVIWDLYVEERSELGVRRVRMRDGRPTDAGNGSDGSPPVADGGQPAAYLTGTVVEPYRTTKDNLSVRLRAARPRVEVDDLEGGGHATVVRGRLLDFSLGYAARAEKAAVVATSRLTKAELLFPAERHGASFTAEINLDKLGAGTRPDDTWDLRLRLRHDDGGYRRTRLRAPRTPAALPAFRLPVAGGDVDAQWYSTVYGNLALKVGDGARIPAAGPVGAGGGGVQEVGQELPAAPPAVRRALSMWFRLAERRVARSRARALPPLPAGPPRVAFVLLHAYGMGGTIRTVFNVANHFAARGHQVEIISLLRSAAEPFFPVAEGVTIRALTSAGDTSPEIPLLPPRMKWLEQRMSKWSSVLWHPREAAYVRVSLLTDLLFLRALRSLEPGVLMTTRPALNVLAARFAPARVRTVGQEHINLSRHNPVLRDWIATYYPRLDALAVLTRGDEDDYHRLLDGTPVRIVRIPNSVSDLGDHAADLSSQVAIAAGRLTRTKGFDRLVPAFRQVADHYPDWQLRIFGHGPQYDKLKQQIADQGLVERVQLMGSTQHMGFEMSRASFYVLSSRYEGFPMVLPEAMSMGLPVVSFDCPRGPSDIVVHDKNGFLVKNGDIDGLAAAMIALVEDEALRRRMGEAARETSRSYSVRNIGSMWLELFDDIRSGRGPLPNSRRGDSSGLRSELACPRAPMTEPISESLGT
jgi:glycosyltransferase involved in cell wall biosynthesis